MKKMFSVVFAVVSASLFLAVSSEGVPDCTFTDPITGDFYDLSPMTRGTGTEDFTKSVQVGQSIEFVYRLNICENTLAPCQGQPGAVTESLKIPAGSTCRVLGRVSGHKFEPLKVPPTADNPLGEGVKLTYMNGDICDPVERSTRTVIINMECSVSEVGSNSPGEVLEMKKDDTCTTTFTMKSPHACSSGATGLGWTFITVFCLGMGMYCIGGALYNWKLRGKNGVEMVPHKEWWAELPALVVDGAKYSMEQTYRFVENGKYWVNEKMSGGASTYGEV